LAILGSIRAVAGDGAVQQPQANGAGAAVLKGQVVCSNCWFEADRKKVAYGTKDDIDCAARCAKTGIPPAIAVVEPGGFGLVHLTDGAFHAGRDGWIPRMGKFVRATGVLEERDGKRSLKVDSLSPISAEEAGFTHIEGVAPPPGGPGISEGSGGERVADPAKGVSGSAGGASSAGGAPAAAGGASSADLALSDLTGTDQRLSAYRGRIVVLNFGHLVHTVPQGDAHPPEDPGLLRRAGRPGDRGLERQGGPEKGGRDLRSQGEDQLSDLARGVDRGHAGLWPHAGHPGNCHPGSRGESRPPCQRDHRRGGRPTPPRRTHHAGAGHRPAWARTGTVDRQRGSHRRRSRARRYFLR
jgi:hypothetical protein